MKLFPFAVILLLASLSVEVKSLTRNLLNQMDEFGQFSFGHGDPFAITESNGVTQGSYQYIDPHGFLHTVKYIADPSNGFRVSDHAVVALNPFWAKDIGGGFDLDIGGGFDLDIGGGVDLAQAPTVGQLQLVQGRPLAKIRALKRQLVGAPVVEAVPVDDAAAGGDTEGPGQQFGGGPGQQFGGAQAATGGQLADAAAGGEEKADAAAEAVEEAQATSVGAAVEGAQATSAGAAVDGETSIRLAKRSAKLTKRATKRAAKRAAKLAAKFTYKGPKNSSNTYKRTYKQ